MCLLTFIPAGVMPDENALLNGSMFNDDGHGYAVVDLTEGRIITGRGARADDVIDEFSTIRARHLNGPALFHSRFATDGAVNDENTHPFAVGGDPRTVLAHNGVMPIRPEANDPRSDTRLVAETWIPRAYGTLRRRRARLAFERWLTSYNKVVILTVDRRFRENAFILNEQSGIWDNGIWYSNDGYRPFGRMSTISSVKYALTGDRLASDQCPMCKASLTAQAIADSYCPECWVCLDCNEYPKDCMCYMPADFKADLARWRAELAAAEEG